MGNYSFNASPVNVHYFTASGNVTGADPVELSGDGKAHRADGTGRYIGIAGQDATPGQTFAVYVGHAEFSGTVEGAISAGDDLAASEVPGHQVKTATSGAEVVGRAFTQAADGTTVKWLQTYAG